MDNINEVIRQSAAEGDVWAKYLTFQIDGQHYGISIAHVIEIVQLQPLTELPEVPYYVKGVINLRGRVVPLIDMSLRFGKPEREYTDRTCVIIVDIDRVHVGLIVDTVEEVLDIDESLIAPPPAFSADASARYVTGIGKLDRYMVLLLDSRLIFSDADIGIFHSPPCETTI